MATKIWHIKEDDIQMTGLWKNAAPHGLWEKCKLTIIRMVKIQNTESIKCWLGCGTAGNLAHWWQEYKMVQQLWKTVLWFLIRLSSSIWPPDANSWLTGKDPDVGKDWEQEEKGATEYQMVGWHHQLQGREFEQTLGDSEGQGSSHKELTWLSESTTKEKGKQHRGQIKFIPECKFSHLKINQHKSLY